MLAARVEPKNGPTEQKDTINRDRGFSSFSHSSPCSVWILTAIHTWLGGGSRSGKGLALTRQGQRLRQLDHLDRPWRIALQDRRLLVIVADLGRLEGGAAGQRRG